MTYMPLASVLIPFLFAVLIILAARGKESIVKVLAVGGTFLTLLCVLTMLPYMLTGRVLQPGTSAMSFPLPVSFGADSLSIFLALIFAFSYLMATIYSLGYIAHSHARSRYYALLLITEGSMVGVVMATSLIGLFLFFEIMAIAAYLLVIHEEDDKAMSAGTLFLYTAIGGGLAIFFGLAVTYYLTGRLDFSPGGYIAASPLAAYGLYAYLLGFGVKAGMFPVHIWLPEAHPAAPAPFSAILSGCSIKVGVYGLIRIMHDVYGVHVIRALLFDRVLLGIAIVTILLGSALALQQDHLKRRLAYSSIAQIGYVLLGISLLTERAMFGALFHIFSHALMKGALFLCAGAIITQTGKKNISEMKGIGYQMPVVMLSFTLASVTMVGIPPFNAFISKWHLALASLEAGQGALVLILMVSSLLNALYYFPVVINAFLSGGEPQSNKLIRDQLPAGMLWTTTLMALLCVGFAFIQPYWPVLVTNRIASFFF